MDKTQILLARHADLVKILDRALEHPVRLTFDRPKEAFSFRFKVNSFKKKLRDAFAEMDEPQTPYDRLMCSLESNVLELYVPAPPKVEDIDL